MAENALAEDETFSPMETAEDSAETSSEGGFVDMLGQYNPGVRSSDKDLVAGRYQIDTDSPLPEYNRASSQAFNATDTQEEFGDIYALVTSNNLPFRSKAIEAFQKISHPSFTRCYAAEPTDLSHLGERRLVFIIERPKGTKLSEIIRKQGALSEKVVLSNILKPLSEAIGKLHQYQVNHGCINPDNIYFDQTAILHECISEPSGYSQHYAYETPERILTLPYGKGSGDLSTDTYALGVLAIHLCNGRLPKNAVLPVEQLQEKLLADGCYNTFMKNLSFSENLMDILRGTLSDNPLERWKTDQLQTCIEGKRYNLILPSPPKDSSRALTYQSENFFGQRALANAIGNSWNQAKTELDASQLVRWLELSTKDSDIASSVEDLLHSALHGSDATIKDMELSQIIALLDPMGPMRLHELIVNVDGLGTALAESFKDNNSRFKQLIVQIIENSLATTYSEFHEKNHNYETINTLWQLQNTKIMLGNNGLGLGLERILYHMNPSLPCQTSILRPYHVINVRTALETLDYIAKDHVNQHSLVDKHLAAFLTAKMEMTKVMRVVELAAFPEFANDNRLIMLKLLAQAQQKVGNPPLQGLTIWAADMIAPIVDMIHKKSTRKTLRKEITKAIKSGLLERLAFVLFQAQIIGDDLQEFGNARALCNFHKGKVKHFSDTKKLRLIAREYGRQISVTIGYLVLAFSVYLVTKIHVNF